MDNSFYTLFYEVKILNAETKRHYLFRCTEHKRKINQDLNWAWSRLETNEYCASNYLPN